MRTLFGDRQTIWGHHAADNRVKFRGRKKCRSDEKTRPGRNGLGDTQWITKPHIFGILAESSSAAG